MFARNPDVLFIADHHFNVKCSSNMNVEVAELPCSVRDAVNITGITSMFATCLTQATYAACVIVMGNRDIHDGCTPVALAKGVRELVEVARRHVPQVWVAYPHAAQLSYVRALDMHTPPETMLNGSYYLYDRVDAYHHLLEVQAKWVIRGAQIHTSESKSNAPVGPSRAESPDQHARSTFIPDPTLTPAPAPDPDPDYPPLFRSPGSLFSW